MRVVDGDVLAGRGVGWLPWSAADSSRRLYPEGWSHTDRATYAVWWGWSGWCGDVAAPVDTEGLAARAGLRPSILRRRPHPAGLWNHRGDRLAVARWDDPYLDAHREQVRYNDYRCSVPARSGLEGATVRWHGHTNLLEPDTGPSSETVNEPLDGVNGIFGRDGAISGSSYGVWVWLVGISLTWVVLGGDGGSGFDAWFGVSSEGAGVVVSESGLEKDC